VAVTVTGTPTLITSLSQAVTIAAGSAVFTWAYYNGSAGTGLDSVTLGGVAPDYIHEVANGDGGADSNASGTAVWLDPPQGSQTLVHSFDAATTEGPVRMLTQASAASGTVGVRTGPNSANATGTNVPSFTFTGLSVDDLIIAMDQKFGAIPDNPSGWTSNQTTSVNSEGARLRSIVATGTSQAVSGNGPNYSSVTGVALYEIAGGGDPEGHLVGGKLLRGGLLLRSSLLG
jgi:hypothetical protein